MTFQWRTVGHQLTVWSFSMQWHTVIAKSDVCSEAWITNSKLKRIDCLWPTPTPTHEQPLN